MRDASTRVGRARLPEATILLVPVRMLLLLSNQAETQTGSYFGLEARIECPYLAVSFTSTRSPVEIGLGLAVFAALLSVTQRRLVEVSRRSAVMLGAILLLVLAFRAERPFRCLGHASLRLPLPVTLALLEAAAGSLCHRDGASPRGGWAPPRRWPWPGTSRRLQPSFRSRTPASQSSVRRSRCCRGGRHAAVGDRPRPRGRRTDLEVALPYRVLRRGGS